MSVRQHAAAALCGAVALAWLTVAITAQDVAGPNLRANYIHRIAVFTEWPSEALPAQDGPLTMCVVGDTAMRDALERAVNGLTVNKRAVVVAYGQPDKPLPQCHILYISAVSSAQAARLISGLREVPVLTISDLERFHRSGGIVEFFYDAGRLRFSIDLDAASKTGLKFSSSLLQFAEKPR